MVSKRAVIGGRRVYFDLSWDIFELQRGGKLDRTDIKKCGTWGSEERVAFCLH